MIGQFRKILAFAALVMIGLVTPGLAEEDRPPLAERAWVYKSPRRPALPGVKNPAGAHNAIDLFLLARLEARNLSFNSPADKLALLRRVSFDLTGLPPTVAEQDAFLADASPLAYYKVVDRLLQSPQYGERWAQHWLDLVRYAETDGFKADDFRPLAHKYRDYVIQALNEDLPYDRFIRQQVAGDELEPGNPRAIIATGLNRLGPDEYNAANLEQRRQEILDDVTEVAGFAFLGLTMGCARCHDHKFDPISQADYFRFQAYFASMVARDHVLPPGKDARANYAREIERWEKAVAPLRREIEKLTGRKRADLRAEALGKFRAEIQQAVLTQPERRTPYQEQIALMAEPQLQRAERDVMNRLPADKKARCLELEKRMSALAPRRPDRAGECLSVTDVGAQAPPTYLLANGDWRRPKKELEPGVPEILAKAVPAHTITPTTVGTGRRSALAEWLTRPDHPLTARVMVNRVWQHHFGRGLIATANDFGVQGEPATHPELLDWLAVEFVANNWSLKHMHRLLVTSAAYRQSSLVDSSDPIHAQARTIDPDNRLLWHAARRRLEGEAIRDAMLLVSEELSRRPYGPSARPVLPAKIGSYAWKPDGRPADQHRRSIYIFAKRNLRYPLFESFDLPDMHNSCSRRACTTTAPQALVLLNGEFALERARSWAGKLSRDNGLDKVAAAGRAFREALGRAPRAEELTLSLDYLSGNSMADFCHALFNCNEFLYVD